MKTWRKADPPQLRRFRSFRVQGFVGVLDRVYGGSSRVLWSVGVLVGF